MSEIMGQRVVVENVGGAGGMTGSKRVADAASDGYSFVLGTVGTHAQGQSLYKKPLYNAATDFTPVALIAEVPIVLIARKDLPVDNLQEFVAYAKANQTKMQYGSAGAGSATHLGCVLLNYLIGVYITHVPYRGTGPAMQDLQGGRIDYLCEIVSTPSRPSRSAWKPELRKVLERVARRARQHDLAASFVDLQGLERHRNHVSAKTKEAADFEDHERNVVLTNDNIGNSADALITIVPKSSPTT